MPSNVKCTVGKRNDPLGNTSDFRPQTYANDQTKPCNVYKSVL